ncbi:AaceriAGL107Wp [[Ashbya] aceris (nom. inval.)]|nr:AaceriAGL107Wp [[Ashbya] aceris (nom. inval.)]
MKPRRSIWTPLQVNQGFLVRMGMNRPILGHLTRMRYSSMAPKESPAVTHPVTEKARVLRHIHFKRRCTFEEGLRIQENYVLHALEAKRMQSKIAQRLRQRAESTASTDLMLDWPAPAKCITTPSPVVLTFEFEPTYTGGKRIKKTITNDEIQALESFTPPGSEGYPNPKFVQVERGGHITFHGPGQMVAYIVLDLKAFHRFTPRCLVSVIEKATINTLRYAPKQETTWNAARRRSNTLGIKAIQTSENGVWIDEKRKIASLGVNVRRSVTSHGVCINVNPTLQYLNNFTMCGLPESSATSIYELVPDATCNVGDVAATFVNELCILLGIKNIDRAVI